MGRYSGLIAGFLFLLAVTLGVFAWWEQRNATVQVEWSTASEMNTAGFNLYRSDNSQGPFVQVNENLIPASSDPLTGGQYRYEDKQVSPGKLYYYQLEEMEMSGASTRFGPISVQASGGSGAVLLVTLAVGMLVLGVGAWLVARQRDKRAKEPPEGIDTGL